MKTVLAQRRHFRCMEYSVEYTLRLAKYIPAVAKCMLTPEGQTFLKKVATWCEENKETPPRENRYRRRMDADDGSDDDGEVYLYKPNAPVRSSRMQHIKMPANLENWSTTPTLLDKMAPLLNNIPEV